MEAMLGECLGLAQGGDGDSAHCSRGAELHMGYRGGQVGLEVGAELGAGVLEARVVVGDVGFEYVQVNYERGGVQFFGGRSYRLQDWAFHVQSLVGSY